MDLDWTAIDHLTKVDPAKSLPDDLGILSKTDAVIVGGSDGITRENMLDTIRTVKNRFPDTPVLQEPYRQSQISLEAVTVADYLAIPAVYNGNYDHFVGKHVDMFTTLVGSSDEVFGDDSALLRDLMDADRFDTLSIIANKILAEAYVIQHPGSAAARVSDVQAPYSPEGVAGTALATEAYYGFPVFYIEYSGTYGGPGDVAAAADYLDETALLYGGGIRSERQTTEILDAGADAVVVGDCFHENPEQFLDSIP